MKLLSRLAPIAALSVLTTAAPAFADSTPAYDITTLAGKVASVNGTAGLQLQLSALLEEEADTSDLTDLASASSDPITPVHVLSSPLDGSTVQAPAVTVNQDTNAASQNETAIAVDPNNSNRVVAAANDYVTRTWSCTVGSTPCSRLGDGYSGTYISNDGGQTWCCGGTDPQHLGTLIPGVDHLAGGQYDAGGDPAVTFDSRGTVYYAGLGFDRLSPPNTVAVNRGTFDAAGNLSWSTPTFINPTTSPSTLNDKEWIAADASPSSPFRDRVYVTWTRFIFNPITGDYVQSPIFEVHSTDGARTFSDPQLIGAPAIYSQGSRPVVAADGTVFVFFFGSIRHAVLPSTFVVKSTDGGQSWSPPVAIADVQPIITPNGARFRVNSFPAAAVAPDGTLYATWSTQVANGGGLCPTRTNTGCHVAAVLSTSTDGGATWSTASPLLPSVDASTRIAIGYPATQPSGAILTAPAPRPVDSFWPGVAVSPSGRVYVSAYAADVVSPWQTCAKPATPTAVGRINCLALDGYVHNARLDYVVRDLTTGVTNIVTTHPINTRYHFGGGFIGDYTDIAVGSDDVFHAVWTDTNNVQTVTWWYGFQFVPTPVHQQDVVVDSGAF